MVAYNEVGTPATRCLHQLPGPPTLDSESATAKSTGAALETQINPNNEATSYAFEYSTEAEGETLKGAVVKVNGASLLQGGEQTGASTAIGALGTYYYRVVAENEQSEKEGKPVVGAVREVTTLPAPHTEAVTSITATTATFDGTLTPLNSAETEYLFDYRVGLQCTGESGTTHVNVGKGSGAKEVSTPVTELQPSQSYSVCLGVQ